MTREDLVKKTVDDKVGQIGEIKRHERDEIVARPELHVGFVEWQIVDEKWQVSEHVDHAAEDHHHGCFSATLFQAHTTATITFNLS